MQRKTNKVVKKLSLDYRIPVKDIEAAINSQFLFVKKIIEDAERGKGDTFKTVKLLSFGKFMVKKNMIKYIINKTNDGDRGE